MGDHRRSTLWPKNLGGTTAPPSIHDARRKGPEGVARLVVDEIPVHVKTVPPALDIIRLEVWGF